MSFFLFPYFSLEFLYIRRSTTCISHFHVFSCNSFTYHVLQLILPQCSTVWFFSFSMFFYVTPLNMMFYKVCFSFFMVFKVTHSYTVFNSVVFLIFHFFPVTPLYTMFSCVCCLFLMVFIVTHSYTMSYSVVFLIFHVLHFNPRMYGVLHCAFLIIYVFLLTHSYKMLYGEFFFHFPYFSFEFLYIRRSTTCITHFHVFCCNSFPCHVLQSSFSYICFLL